MDEGEGEDGGRGRRHVVLVGLMGVGKTTVGRRLARELQRPFADADEQLELRAGRTIPVIFRDDGEAAFRRLESEVLADLLGRTHPLVVAAGGGVVTGAENRALLSRHGFVVWLRASAGFLATRIDPTHRPLLATDPPEAEPRRGRGPSGPAPKAPGAGDTARRGGAERRLEAAIERLIAERSPLYEDVADAIVDVEPFHSGDDKPKRALAHHIAALVGVPAEAPG
ncbi:MAG TPA: shikimate kinase [Acidimicrobiales bacterium]|jgi:shikimate kinase|nr:shikimate kinase [Acidimicrobiales bacterium]